ncbi:protein of unknown function [Candidatus Hydrogenisulfobacillus filiaventi]|uniref:Uncharacterized protein n=1 Tax=Candidatus Hydrogenisulfobacillus filiaventi TaxID=2707344 RepID=A0A6F8ZEF9_9FIRM|nr:hypothetical protein [Bacillota bacterium]CAB1128311.1 protein of unknown function [Candidatus Hydrogenisulfobacillus filiaventi]
MADVWKARVVGLRALHAIVGDLHRMGLLPAHMPTGVGAGALEDLVTYWALAAAWAAYPRTVYEHVGFVPLLAWGRWGNPPDRLLGLLTLCPVCGADGVVWVNPPDPHWQWNGQFWEPTVMPAWQHPACRTPYALEHGYLCAQGPHA